MGQIEDRIAAAQTKLAQLKALKEKQEARKVTALVKGKSAQDTRRKILAGALVIDQMSKNAEYKVRFTASLDKYLTRADDRALFDLPPLPAASE